MKINEITENFNIVTRLSDIALDEERSATRKLCLSTKPNSELSAVDLAWCKCMGLRSREGKKSHKIGKKRITVGGKKIKGKSCGGSLPDYSGK
jgi:hypothetical protein